MLDNFVRGRRENLAGAMERGTVTIVEGDIRDRGLLADAMKGIDVVFHQAAIRITQCAEEPRLALEVLVDGTFNVLEAAVGAGVRKVVAASSASVYGLAEEFPTTERHHPYNNRTLYGAAKVFNEGLLRSFHEMYGLDYVALRYFNVYGPRMDVHGAYTEVLIRWMERIAAGEPPVIFGDGQSDDGLRLRRGRRAGQHPGGAVAPVTDDGVQRRERRRDQPDRPGRRPVTRDGRGRRARVGPGARRRGGAAAAGRHEPRAPAAGLAGASIAGRGARAPRRVVARPSARRAPGAGSCRLSGAWSRPCTACARWRPTRRSSSG